VSSCEEIVVNERLRILQLVESGQISVEEGVRRLERLGQGGLGQAPALEDRDVSAAPTDVEKPSDEPVHVPFLRAVWQIVFGVGVAVLVGGGLLLARAYGREGRPGFNWGWVLLAFGLLVMILGWWLQRARWFYLRVREHRGRAFTIALPLPLRLVAWLLRVAKPFVPQLQEMDADHLILTMQDELRRGRPIVITVDEGEAGDQVEMYFG
jgi:hypothetical protein